jgi:hypothetical protein
MYLPYTPGNLYEYQKKGLTKFAFRKRLILNGMSSSEQKGSCRKTPRKEEKREQAPALHTQLSTEQIIAQIRGLSRAILGFLTLQSGRLRV